MEINGWKNYAITALLGLSLGGLSGTIGGSWASRQEVETAIHGSVAFTETTGRIKAIEAAGLDVAEKLKWIVEKLTSIESTQKQVLYELCRSSGESPQTCSRIHPD